MFKNMLLIALVLTFALSAGVVGLLPDSTHVVDSSGDTLVAARWHFTEVVVLADPECPLPSSGTGGGC